MRSFVNSYRFIHEFRRTFIHAFMLSFLHAFLLAFSHAFLPAFLRAFKQAIIHEFTIHSYEIQMLIHATFIHLAVFIVVIKRRNCARTQQRHRRILITCPGNPTNADGPMPSTNVGDDGFADASPCLLRGGLFVRSLQILSILLIDHG